MPESENTLRRKESQLPFPASDKKASLILGAGHFALYIAAAALAFFKLLPWPLFFYGFLVIDFWIALVVFIGFYLIMWMPVISLSFFPPLSFILERPALLYPVHFLVFAVGGSVIYYYAPRFISNMKKLIKKN